MGQKTKSWHGSIAAACTAATIAGQDTKKNGEITVSEVTTKDVLKEIHTMLGIMVAQKNILTALISSNSNHERLLKVFDEMHERISAAFLASEHVNDAVFDSMTHEAAALRRQIVHEIAMREKFPEPKKTFWERVFG